MSDLVYVLVAQRPLVAHTTMQGATEEMAQYSEQEQKHMYVAECRLVKD